MTSLLWTTIDPAIVHAASVDRDPAAARGRHLGGHNESGNQHTLAVRSLDSSDTSPLRSRRVRCLKRWKRSSTDAHGAPPDYWVVYVVFGLRYRRAPIPG